jgi:hypothetical protein
MLFGRFHREDHVVQQNRSWAYFDRFDPVSSDIQYWIFLVVCWKWEMPLREIVTV